jgi:hypothetical protein
MEWTYRILYLKYQVLLISFLIFCILVTCSYADVINLAKDRPYTIDKPASEHYPDTDHKLLTDGKFGADKDLDCGDRLCAPGWVGFNQGPPIITFDLENIHEIKRVSVSYLSFPSKAVNPPSGIRIEGSYDGVHWKGYGYLKKDEKQFELRDFDLSARYLRFIIMRNQWAFLDEIIIEGDPVPTKIDSYLEPLKRVLVVTSDLEGNDERLIRLENLLDGMGLKFKTLNVDQIHDVEFLDYQLLIFASSSKIPLDLSVSQEQRIVAAIHSGTNVLWIGGGIWGSFKTTDLADAFGVRYLKQNSNEHFGVRFAEYINIAGRKERLPINHETMWVVESKDAKVISWYLDEDGRQVEIPFITRMEGDLVRGIGTGLYIALPLLDRWKTDEDYFTFARAEILAKAIRSLISDGLVGKHPAANAHDAVFMLRLEDYTPGGIYMGHSSRSWLMRMNRLLALTDKYQIPLNIGIIPKYNHPFLNETHDWEEQDPTIIKLKQMAQTAFDRGGSLIVHGFDHQNGNAIDDYSGDDWETYDEDKKEFLPLEQQQLITDSAYAEIEKTWGLKPVIWETPHYISNADTFRAAHKSGFHYFTESDTKIFPNWSGYHNNSNGLLLNIPETGAFFQANFAEVKEKTLIKQLHILPRIVRMNALFLVFYHNMSEDMHRALENLLMTSSNFSLWKPSMEEYAKFWEKRQKVSINSNIDRKKGQIYATINDAFDGFTLAIQLPAGVTPNGMTINGQAIDVKKRQIGKNWILYPVLKEGTHDVIVTYN